VYNTTKPRHQITKFDLVFDERKRVEIEPVPTSVAQWNPLVSAE